MPSLNEIRGQPTEMRAALQDGLEILDNAQEVTFQAYSRTVLPIDGYVFWTPAETICIKGSLHYTQEMVQTEDETFGSATATFTTAKRIVEFEKAPPNTIYVGCIDGVRFAFSQQQGYYGAAQVWHYFGHSLPPAMQAQLLDQANSGAIDPSQAVTSNSLALWIALNTFTFPPVWNGVMPGMPQGFTLYPAGLSPPNLLPAYGTIDVQDTRALSAVTNVDPRTSTSTQQNADRVKITIYGLQHNAGIDFLNNVFNYIRLSNNFGLMNMPTVIDEKRNMAELQALAMKKAFYFEISYTQTRVNDIARQLIEKAVAMIYGNPTPIST